MTVEKSNPILCPNCGSDQSFVNRVWSYQEGKAAYFVVCKSCGQDGPWSASELGAMEAWQKPLTEWPLHGSLMSK